MLDGTVYDKEESVRGSFVYLCSIGNWTTSTTLAIVLFNTGAIQNCVAYATPYLHSTGYCGLSLSSSPNTIPCTFAYRDVIDTFIYSLGESIGVIIFALLSELFGRIKNLKVASVLLTGSLAAALLCWRRLALLVELVLQRTLCFEVYMLLYLYILLTSLTTPPPT